MNGQSNDVRELIRNSAGFENKQSAIDRYKVEHDGTRDVVPWGKDRRPIEVITKGAGTSLQTFLNLGGVEEIPVEGNDEAAINKLVEGLTSSAPMVTSKFDEIHMSRLKLKPMDGEGIGRDYFVVTGKLKMVSG